MGPLWAAAMVLSIATPVPAEDAPVDQSTRSLKQDDVQTRIVRLNHASAADIARMFGGTGRSSDGGDPTEGRHQFLERALQDAIGPVRPLPDMVEPGVYPFPERSYAEVRVAQTPGGPAVGGNATGTVGDANGLTGLLPEGLEGAPIALPEENALIVRGTPAAIDEFREILSLLDKRPRQVNIEVKLVDLLSRIQRDWGADLAWDRGPLDVDVVGPAPPGATLRWGTATFSPRLGASRIQSSGNNTTAANVTTTNNHLCVIRAATLIPFVAATVTYNQFGQRTVDYAVDAVATGVELFCLPRINANDTVTLWLRPSFIEPNGRVVGPDGSTIPITDSVLLDSAVTVRDGETLLLGGFPRSMDSLETLGFPVHVRRSSVVDDSESLAFVTPRIVRTLTE